ncbi:MAG: hypothetical protein JXA07_12675 [Spirochaetes bacterium]|nr:hypothetical protein [Spirochaetota bacterium]
MKKFKKWAKKIKREYKKSKMSPARFVFWTLHSDYDDWKAGRINLGIVVVPVVLMIPIFKIAKVVFKIEQMIEIRRRERRCRIYQERKALKSKATEA